MRPKAGTAIHIRIDPVVLAEIDRLAAVNRTTRVAVIRHLLAKGLVRHGR